MLTVSCVFVLSYKNVFEKLVYFEIYTSVRLSKRKLTETLRDDNKAISVFSFSKPVWMFVGIIVLPEHPVVSVQLSAADLRCSRIWW